MSYPLKPDENNIPKSIFDPNHVRNITKEKKHICGRVSPSLGAFGAHGHVRIPSFDEISHVSDLDMSF